MDGTALQFIIIIIVIKKEIFIQWKNVKLKTTKTMYKDTERESKRLLHSSPQLDSIHFSLDHEIISNLLSCACFKNPYFIIGISSTFFHFS